MEACARERLLTRRIDRETRQPLYPHHNVQGKDQFSLSGVCAEVGRAHVSVDLAGMIGRKLGYQDPCDWCLKCKLEIMIVYVFLH